MPESASHELSSESLNALLLALGLTGSENSVEQSNIVEPIVGVPRFVQTDSCVPQRPLTPFSELEEISAREILSDFDICADLDNDIDSDPFHSRLGSSPESFEVISPPGIHPRCVFRKTRLRTSSLSSPPSADQIYIKAAHNASIIMIRTPPGIKFADLKRRLHDKFVNQENTLLSHSFSVVLALPPSSNPGCRRMSLASRTEMRFIDDETDWKKITTANDGSKITLRILDTPP